MELQATPPPSALTPPPFGPLRQIDAGVLDVGYVDAGPTAGPAVVLLHGWPYDIHSFTEVVPLLTAAGCRVIVPSSPGSTGALARPTSWRRCGPSAAAAWSRSADT